MSLGALAGALRAHGGTVAEHVLEPKDGEQSTGPAQLAAAGPRVRGDVAEYELLLELILEGSLLHYGRPRVLRVEDPDLALLLGDQLYALGLARLAALGDLESVAQLADVISLVARARAGGDEELAEAVWQAGAAAIGWGSTPEHEAAKARARSGDAGASTALRRSARREGREGGHSQ